MLPVFVLSILLFTSFRVLTSYVIAWSTPFRGSSMEPTSISGDRYLLDLFTFKTGLRGLQPGDIITVRGGGFSEGRATKRLIAVEGQTVQIKDCHVFINDRPLTDNAFNHPGHPHPQRQCYYNAGVMQPSVRVFVPPGHFFVLGDNSANSNDSRFAHVGMIRPEDVLMRLFFRIWPLNRVGVP